MVETQLVSTDMPTRPVFPIHLANNTLPRTWTSHHASQLTFARIAHGHPLLRTKLDKRTVSPFHTRNISSQTTTVSQELTR